MKIVSRLIAVGALMTALSACAFNVEPFLGKEINGTDFNTYLAREYQRRTGVEVNVDMEWNHASRLADKGERALAGETVLPWNPADWNVAPEDMADLQAARDRLMRALDSGGRERQPEACAKAQVYYDGWLEQANDNDWGVTRVGPVQPDYVAAERAAFEEIIPLCEGGEGYVIYFGWDRADLTDAAIAVIDQIASMVSGTNLSVSVVGHTDTSGPGGYNDGLSNRRASAVAGALSQRNVPVQGTSGAGENDLAEPTADGVREPLNRRAVVTIN